MDRYQSLCLPVN